MSKIYPIYDNSIKITSNCKRRLSRDLIDFLVNKKHYKIDKAERIYILDKNTRAKIAEYEIKDTAWFEHFGDGNIILAEGIKEDNNQNNEVIRLLLQYSGTETHYVDYIKSPSKTIREKYSIYSTLIFSDNFSISNNYVSWTYSFTYNDEIIDKFIKDTEIRNNQREIERKLHINKCKMTRAMLETKKILAIPAIFYSGETPRISMSVPTQGGRYIPKRGAYIPFKSPKFMEASSAYFEVVDTINETITKFIKQFNIKFDGISSDDSE